MWGISSAPLVDGELLIVQVGGENACLVAFDKKTGKEKWRALDDPASYSAPIIIKHYGKRVLVCYTGKHVAGLDPRTGKVYWKYPFPPKQMVIGCASPVYHEGYIFVTNFFDGCLLLRLLPDKMDVEKVWQRAGPSEKNTDGLQSIISTPYLAGPCIYGVESYGELRCLNLKDGSQVWESLAAVPKARWATIHFVKNGDKVWMFNERGDLILSKLSPEGYNEISRAKLIEPTESQLPQRGGIAQLSAAAISARRGATRRRLRAGGSRPRRLRCGRRRRRHRFCALFHRERAVGARSASRSRDADRNCGHARRADG